MSLVMHMSWRHTNGHTINRCCVMYDDSNVYSRTNVPKWETLMVYQVHVLFDKEWKVIKECKTKVVAEVFVGLIMDNETKVVEVEPCSCCQQSSL